MMNADTDRNTDDAKEMSVSDCQVGIS